MSSADPLDFAHIMLITAAITTAAWLAVTFLTAPEPSGQLAAGVYINKDLSRRGWKTVVE